MPGGGFDADRFDPVEGVLEDEKGIRLFGEREDELVGEEWVGWGGTDVEEERCVVRHDAFDFGCPLLAPGEELLSWCGVLEG